MSERKIKTLMNIMLEITNEHCERDWSSFDISHDYPFPRLIFRYVLCK